MHPKKYIVQNFLLLIDQATEIQDLSNTRKTPLATSRSTSTTFLFCQDKHKLHVLDSLSPLQSLLSTTPKECTDVRAYGHVITKFSWMDRLPNCVSYGAMLVRESCICGAPL